MLWRRARDNYYFAIDPRVREYLRLTTFWRTAIWGTSLMLAFGAIVLAAGLIFWAMTGRSQSTAGAVSLVTFLAMAFGFWLPVLDRQVEKRVIGSDCNRLLAQPSVIYATRAEYLGGHVNFPHPRFCYLTLNGQRANPYLSVHWEDFPILYDSPALHALPWSQTHPSVSLRDVDRSELARDEEFDPLLVIERRFDGRVGVRDALQVRYNGPGSRRFILELANFEGGQEDLRWLRNTIICAVAEAEGEITIKDPWKSLPLIDDINPPKEVPDDRAAWRRPLPPEEYRRAFRRI